MPFAPTLTAGSTTDQAGGYTDFSMLLSRGDGQQRFSSLSFKAPEGLSGMIASVPLCGEQQANEGTCPAASQIGHTVVGAGPGPYPFYIPQQNAPPTPIYLTGPYHGAPFGLSIVTPVVAGPFNLGYECCACADRSGSAYGADHDHDGCVWCAFDPDDPRWDPDGCPFDQRDHRP